MRFVKSKQWLLESCRTWAEEAGPEILYLTWDCKGAFHSLCSSTTPRLQMVSEESITFGCAGPPGARVQNWDSRIALHRGIPAPCCRPGIPAPVHINTVSWSIQLDFRNCLAHPHHSLHWTCILRFGFWSWFGPSKQIWPELCHLHN